MNFHLKLTPMKIGPLISLIFISYGLSGQLHDTIQRVKLKLNFIRHIEQFEIENDDTILLSTQKVNKEGYIISDNQYKNGALNTEYKFIYLGDTLLSESSCVATDQNLPDVIKYFYNSDKRIEKTNFYQENDLINTVNHFYSPNGKINKNEQTLFGSRIKGSSNGKITSKFSYNLKGHLIELETKSSFGGKKKKTNWYFTYDNKGNLTEVYKRNKKFQKAFLAEIYKYDQMLNLQIHESFYEYGLILHIGKGKKKLNPSDSFKRIKIYNEDGLITQVKNLINDKIATTINYFYH
jgi:hypothetical protein